MSNHYEWAEAKHAEFTLCSRYDAEEELYGVEEDDFGPHQYGLFIGANGDGIIINGSADELNRLIDRLQRHVEIQLRDYELENESRSTT